MKINPNYVLRHIAGSWVIFQLELPEFQRPDLLTLNDSAAMLWRKLETGCSKESLVTVLTDEYEVSTVQAGADVDEFIEKLTEIGCIQL